MTPPKVQWEIVPNPIFKDTLPYPYFDVEDLVLGQNKDEMSLVKIGDTQVLVLSKPDKNSRHDLLEPVYRRSFLEKYKPDELKNVLSLKRIDPPVHVSDLVNSWNSISTEDQSFGAVQAFFQGLEHYGYATVENGVYLSDVKQMPVMVLSGDEDERLRQAFIQGGYILYGQNDDFKTQIEKFWDKFSASEKELLTATLRISGFLPENDPAFAGIATYLYGMAGGALGFGLMNLGSWDARFCLNTSEVSADCKIFYGPSQPSLFYLSAKILSEGYGLAEEYTDPTLWHSVKEKIAHPKRLDDFKAGPLTLDFKKTPLPLGSEKYSLSQVTQKAPVSLLDYFKRVQAEESLSTSFELVPLVDKNRRAFAYFSKDDAHFMSFYRISLLQTSGKIPTDDETKKKIAEANTLGSTVAGVNLSLSDMIRFFNSAQKENIDLLPQEAELKKQLIQDGFVKQDDAALLHARFNQEIGFMSNAKNYEDGESWKTTLHEFAHMIFATQPAFAKSVDQALKEFNLRELQLIASVLRADSNYQNESREALEDELMAYSTDSPLEKYFGLNPLIINGNEAAHGECLLAQTFDSTKAAACFSLYKDETPGNIYALVLRFHEKMIPLLRPYIPMDIRADWEKTRVFPKQKVKQLLGTP